MISDPRLTVFEDRDLLTRAAADLIVDVASAAVSERGRFTLALSGGGTPEPVYRMLASEPYRSKVDWSAGHFFWGDERCVPPTDPESNFGQAKRLLLDNLETPAAQIHRIKGELTADEAAADYRRLLADFAGEGSAWPALDLALMGLGADGHTASLFPGPPAAGEDRLAAIATTADYEGRPAQRVSLTPPVFNSARHVLFLVAGAQKAEAAAALLDPDADPVRWPATRLKPVAGRLHYYLDEAAAGSLS